MQSSFYKKIFQNQKKNQKQRKTLFKTSLFKTFFNKLIFKPYKTFLTTQKHNFLKTSPLIQNSKQKKLFETKNASIK